MRIGVCVEASENKSLLSCKRVEFCIGFTETTVCIQFKTNSIYVYGRAFVSRITNNG